MVRRGDGIALRLMDLAVAVIRVADRLPKGIASRHVVSQVVRSASGAGANYEEARAAESRNDFIHKASIALKEVRETVYWLGLITRAGWTTLDTTTTAREATEIVAILGASIRTARLNRKG